MNTRQLIQASLFTAALFSASASFAFSGANGSPAAATSTAVALSVTPQTEHFNVHYGDVVRFTLADGSSFNWQFDTHSNYVSLADIAPKGATVNPDLRVYVTQPAIGDNR